LQNKIFAKLGLYCKTAIGESARKQLLSSNLPDLKLIDYNMWEILLEEMY